MLYCIGRDEKQLMVGLGRLLFYGRNCNLIENIERFSMRAFFYFVWPNFLVVAVFSRSAPITAKKNRHRVIDTTLQLRDGRTNLKVETVSMVSEWDTITPSCLGLASLSIVYACYATS
jgi:hypothetical protein